MKKLVCIFLFSINYFCFSYSGFEFNAYIPIGVGMVEITIKFNYEPTIPGQSKGLSGSEFEISLNLQPGYFFHIDDNFAISLLLDVSICLEAYYAYHSSGLDGTSLPGYTGNSMSFSIGLAPKIHIFDFAIGINGGYKLLDFTESAGYVRGIVEYNIPTSLSYFNPFIGVYVGGDFAYGFNVIDLGGIIGIRFAPQL